MAFIAASTPDTAGKNLDSHVHVVIPDMSCLCMFVSQAAASVAANASSTRQLSCSLQPTLQHVFIDRFQKMELIVRNPSRTTSVEADIHVELAYADNGVSPDQSVLTVQPPVPKVSPGSGTVSFQFKISNPTNGQRMVNGRKFVLYVQPARPGGAVNFDMVRRHAIQHL